MAQNKPKNPEKHSTYLSAKEKKSTKPFHKTPMLDQLESGPWPSFVTGLKRLAHDNNMMVDLLGQLEHSYKTRLGYWKGGTVIVFGYGGGIIPRFSDYVDGKPCSPSRKNSTPCAFSRRAGNHYTTDMLRQLSDSWDKYGSGLIAFHGQTGNIMFIGTTTENTQHFFDEINEYGWDLGGAGPCVRTAMSLRRRGALRAVLRQRAEDPPPAGERLHRRHAPPGPALQVQVQGFGLPERLHELDPARRLGRDRHLARRHAGRPEGSQGLRARARAASTSSTTSSPAARPRRCR